MDLKLNTPLYSPEPHETEIENERVKWAQMKQSKLQRSEKIIVLKTLKA